MPWGRKTPHAILDLIGSNTAATYAEPYTVFEYLYLIRKPVTSMPTTIPNERPRRARVLTAIGSLNRGGAETWLLNMVTRIDRQRFQMDVLVDTDGHDAYTSEFIKVGCRILPCGDYQQPWRYFTNLKQLYAENGPYDILH